MRTLFALSLVTSLLPRCEAAESTPIRASLDEDQILVGGVHAGILTLDTGLGPLDIPLEDVGEVEPIEAADLGGSARHVRIWLRNGSELVGRWTDPSVTVDVPIGDVHTTVDLPMDEVTRLQLEGATAWPGPDTFRIRTAYGDDLFVDAEETLLPFDTDLGRFTPPLSAMTSAVPLDGPEGRWRITLQTGTVLVGSIGVDTLDLALPMGPERVQVALADVRHLARSSVVAKPTAGRRWYDASPMRIEKARTH